VHVGEDSKVDVLVLGNGNTGICLDDGRWNTAVCS